MSVDYYHQLFTAIVIENEASPVVCSIVLGWILNSGFPCAEGSLLVGVLRLIQCVVF